MSPNPIIAYRRANGLGFPLPDEEVSRNRKLESKALTYGFLDRPNWAGYSCGLEYAIGVFSKRAEYFGKSHQYLEILKTNQKSIFDYCRSNKNKNVPKLEIYESNDAALSKIINSDLEYYEAALIYYRFDHFRNQTHSRERFELIAGDINSPHRAMAHYMVAHLSANAEGPEKATPLIEAILGDPSLRSIHRISRQILDVIAYRSDSSELIEGQVARIGEILAVDAARLQENEDLKRQYEVALQDIGWFLNGGPPDGPRSAALERVAPTTAILDWLRFDYFADRGTFWQKWIGDSRESSWEEFDYRQHLLAAALKRYDGGEGLLWAVAALGLSEAGGKRTGELLELAELQARKAATCSLSQTERPLHDRILVHYIRLLIQRGEFARAVSVLERHVAKSPDIAWSEAAQGAAGWLIAYGHHDLARRVLAVDPHFAIGMRQLIARSFSEFLAADYTSDGAQSTKLVLNLMPLARLIDVTRDESVQKNLRIIVGRVAFVRALMLEGVTRAREVLGALKPIDPEVAAYLMKFDQAWVESRQRNLAALAIARMPGMNISLILSERTPQSTRYHLTKIDGFDRSDENWWCPFDVRYARLEMEDYFFDHTLPKREFGPFDVVRRRILAEHPVLRLVSEEELAKLSRVPSGPKFLAEQAVSWARSSGFWSRLIGYERGLPELLALSVRATRYGCERAGGHGIYSQAAFRQLHEQFPLSDRSKQTRWWFDCEHFRRGCVGSYSKADLEFQSPWDRRW